MLADGEPQETSTTRPRSQGRDARPRVCPKPLTDLTVMVDESEVWRWRQAEVGTRQGFEADLKLRSKWNSGKNRQRAGRLSNNDG